jgi:hypothetical protein
MISITRPSFHGHIGSYGRLCTFDQAECFLWILVHRGLSSNEVAEDENYAKSRPKSKAGAEWVSAPTAR